MPTTTKHRPWCPGDQGHDNETACTELIGTVFGGVIVLVHDPAAGPASISVDAQTRLYPAGHLTLDDAAALAVRLRDLAVALDALRADALRGQVAR